MPKVTIVTIEARALSWVLLCLLFLLQTNAAAQATFGWPFEKPKFYWVLPVDPPNSRAYGYDTMEEAANAGLQPLRAISPPDCNYQLVPNNDGTAGTLE